MRLDGRERSNNIEDRRGLGGGFRGGGKSTGLVGIIVVLIGAYYGVDLSGLMGDGAQLPRHSVEQAPRNYSQQEQQLEQLGAIVLKETENIWGNYFKNVGLTYTMPTMVLYSGVTSTACGTGNANAGPFYCPADQKLYIDLSFYETMKNQLGAGGDAAFAYVLAHEVGHHVQTLLGTIQKVHQAQSQMGERERNVLSVKLELQADCYAGVWGHYAQQDGLFEEGDIEEAYNAAEAVGDDMLQKRAQGYTVPHTYTHGTSANRKAWLERGLYSGDINQCNTFGNKVS